ncbi:MAG: glycosyltransferase family 2 protein [Candidatus Saccharimonadales bacterium]
MSHKVTIVIPIYADWPSLKDCLNSLNQHLDKRHRVLLINDSGPEAELLEKNIKKEIADWPNFEYFRNDKNLGFVKTCNKAVMGLDKTDNDILLLNSDTKVTKGFLEEMLGVLYSQKNIGTVSPRSNNANNCTIPLAAFIDKKNLKSERSYAIFQKHKDKFPRYHIMPTANGFCMLIRRSLIKKYGLFDPAFGAGYGEEVDFCQRIAQHGWLSVLSNWAFVFHLEAKSFSLETKAKLLEERRKMLQERWPKFKPAITEDIENSLLEEKKLLGKDAGTEIPYNLNRPTVTLKRLIRRNKHIHRLAQALKTRLAGPSRQ